MSERRRSRRLRPADVHALWAPDGSSWSPWVKPVLFAALAADAERVTDASPAALPEAPSWIEAELLAPLEEARANATASENPYRGAERPQDTALVIDLPGARGVELGVLLATYGWRPIPLYNAMNAAISVVAVTAIMEALARHALLLEGVPLASPPAFLLDARRLARGAKPRPGHFDNRSMCRPTDFPSSARFEREGIRRIVLLCDALRDDLEDVVIRWQEAGLEVWGKSLSTTDVASPLVRLPRPSWPRRMWKLVTRAALRPREDGSYGAIVPVPSAS